jgi:hypothetical protein
MALQGRFKVTAAVASSRDMRRTLHRSAGQQDAPAVDNLQAD